MGAAPGRTTGEGFHWFVPRCWAATGGPEVAAPSQWPPAALWVAGRGARDLRYEMTKPLGGVPLQLRLTQGLGDERQIPTLKIKPRCVSHLLTLINFGH